jgi:hypothetical protein
MREGPRRTLAKYSNAKYAALSFSSSLRARRKGFLGVSPKQKLQESEVIKVKNQQQEAGTINMTTYTFMFRNMSPSYVIATSHCPAARVER